MLFFVIAISICIIAVLLNKFSKWSFEYDEFLEGMLVIGVALLITLSFIFVILRNTDGRIMTGYNKVKDLYSYSMKNTYSTEAERADLIDECKKWNAVYDATKYSKGNLFTDIFYNDLILTYERFDYSKLPPVYPKSMQNLNVNMTNTGK